VANKFGKLAQADLDPDSIWAFIAADSITAANGLIKRIGGVFKMLVQSPLAGRERAGLRSNLRSLPLGNYIVFYRALPDGVEIVRVMSGRQDFDADDMA
jgi:toxin ParE1/3/4